MNDGVSNKFGRLKRLGSNISGSIKQLMSIVIIVIGIAILVCAVILPFLTSQEINVIDITSQMSGEYRESLEQQISEMEKSKRINFLFAYHNDTFEISDEYIRNIDKSRGSILGNKVNVFYVYMKANNQLFKVQDGLVQELRNVENESEIVDSVILDMSKTKPNDFSYVINYCALIAFLLLSSILIVKGIMIYKRETKKNKNNLYHGEASPQKS